MQNHMKRYLRGFAGLATASMVAAVMFTASSAGAFPDTGDASPNVPGHYVGTPHRPGPSTIMYPPIDPVDETETGGGLVLPPPPTGASGPVGINLAVHDPYTVEWVFVDAMKVATRWYPQTTSSNSPWDTGAYLELTADDYPVLASGQAAATLMFPDLQGHYPGGNYVCLYDGQGTIEFGNDAHLVSQSPGRIVVNVTPSNGGMILRVVASSSSNPVRNIRMIMPGHEATYQTQPFNPTFLATIEKFSVLRFMDWQRTNGSSQQNWAGRSKLSHRTQATDKGIAVEYLVQLCNTIGADGWFCMPHKATDDYVTQFATYVRDNLNPNRKAYIEHSNETWNNGFPQAGYCAQQGQAQGLASDSYLAQIRYHSKRSVQIFDIWKNVFGAQASTRMVRVLAAQHDNPWVGRQVMDYQNAYQKADAVAVAPYFGSNLGWPSSANQVAGWTITQILNSAQDNIATRRQYTIEEHNDAHARGLDLIAYEGGQHLVGVGEAQGNQALASKFQQANRDPRMKDLYLEDLYGWVTSGGGMFVAFSSAGRYGDWGSWGVMEHQDQPRAQAPKYDALLTFIEGYEGDDSDPPLLGDTVGQNSFIPPPDGLVNAADLAFLLQQWGINPGSPADIVSASTFAPPGDGVVDSADLAVLLGNWSN